MPEEKSISDMKILFHSNAMSEMRNKSRRLSKTSRNNFQIFPFQFLLTMQVMQRFATSGWSKLTLVINSNVRLLMGNVILFQPLPIMQHEKLETSATLREEKYDDLAEAAKARVEF